jgi:hypothetical protein
MVMACIYLAQNAETSVRLLYIGNEPLASIIFE